MHDGSRVLARQVAIALMVAASLTAKQSAQPAAPAGTGVIVGRVVDGTSGAAVVGVTVTISGAAAPPTGKTVLVDSKGRFVFSDLASGSFGLVAEKNGYLTGAFGRARPAGQSQTIVLPNGGRITDAQIKIWPAGSIDGRVVDEAGEPVSGAQLYALSRTWVSGHPSLSTNYSAASDDRGMYHIGRLPPGEYVIGMTSRLATFPIGFVEDSAADQQASANNQAVRDLELAAKGSNMGNPTKASPRVGNLVLASSESVVTPVPDGNGRLAIFPITFFPSASTSETATPIVLAAGEHRTAVDIHLRLTPTLTISGTATGPTGPIANLGLRLHLPPSSQFYSRFLFEPAQAVTDANGRFVFLGVPPGSYVIIAAMTLASGQAESVASVELPVTLAEKDLLDVSLVLRLNPRISGRIEFDGTSERPTGQRIGPAIGLDPADGHFERQGFQVDAAGTITTRGVLPGKYFIHVDRNLQQSAQLGSWTLRSATVNGRDVSDVPFRIDDADITDLVITLTDHPPTLNGNVRDVQGAADVTATVLVFPVDRSLWVDYGVSPRRLRSTRTDRNGGFTVPALPAGEYFVVAVPDEIAGDWQRQTFLEKAAAAATRVNIEEAKSATVGLVTKRWSA